jgi:hypothetical protein
VKRAKLGRTLAWSTAGLRAPPLQPTFRESVRELPESEARYKQTDIYQLGSRSMARRQPFSSWMDLHRLLTATRGR